MVRNRRLSTYLIIGGILLMIIPLVGSLITRSQQEQMLREYEESLRLQSSQLNTSFEEASEGFGNEETANSPLPPKKPEEKPEQVIGMIRIPAIDSELLVVEGTDSLQLRWGAGHLTGSVYPGEAGNCVLAAHRDYTFGTYFSRLDELEEGDPVEVEYLGVTHSYRVTGSMVTTPDDLSVLMPTENPLLTLITCHPRGSGKERLIVTAEPY